MPRFDPDVHDRRSIRLRGYDYAQAGAYFVTVVVQGRECLFGDVINGSMLVNTAGALVRGVWDSLPDRLPNVELDAFVVMPNHVHGIVVLHDVVPPVVVTKAGAQQAAPLPDMQQST